MKRKREEILGEVNTIKVVVFVEVITKITPKVNRKVFIYLVEKSILIRIAYSIPATILLPITINVTQVEVHG